MNMQKFSSLLLVLHIINNGMTAPPALFPVEENQPPSKSYLDGYPQRQQLEQYVPYLLSYLRRSGDLSTINLALWNHSFDNKQQACEAVSAYLEKRHLGGAQDSSSKHCNETYVCDYDEYRFPATLIAVQCGGGGGGGDGDGYCSTTRGNWPVLGTCLGDQYYLNTMQFIPDTPPALPVIQQVNHVASSGDGESNQNSAEPVQGRWAFQTTFTNKACLCAS